MGAGLPVEKEINAIKENAYEAVIVTASEVIKEYHGEEVVGKEALANFISKMRDKLLSTDLSVGEVANIGQVLMREDRLGKFTGSFFLVLNN
ncbi:hypothetical protein [Bacillus cereus]|uniref:hypothetical protein n=1 Tax=Bacillus cereus TaxID=1396 RepID=UPI00027C12B4|nr:hypothetical protein [Bacillus cereus]EJV56408.1 hypothetical protein IEM_05290 [Bacillus cereus BAG6O-2]